MTVDYKQIKEFAKANDMKVGDLTALDTKNDPFYFGTETDKKKAKWAEKYWKEMGSPYGVHPRRIHYYIVSLSNPTRYDGTPYKNTETDWKHLSECLKAARYLGTVPFEAITDKRNPKPTKNHTPESDEKYVPWPVQPDSGLKIRTPNFKHSSVDEAIESRVNELVKQQFHNTRYSRVGRQPCLCEVWLEKSTMTDIVAPLARKYSANLQEGKGESSITMALNLVQRIRKLKREGFLKPVRVFYISDYDPHGQNMPKSMARHLEFFVRDTVDFDVDIKIKALALTGGQCRKYELPTTPVSDERMLGKWGEERTELDALEAQHPGLLEEIVEDALKEYYDPEMGEKVRQAEQDMRDEIEEEIRGEFEDRKQELEETRKSLTQALEEIREKVENWKKENEGLINRYNSLFDIDPDLSEIEFEEPNTDVSPGEGDEWFFDSQLGYSEQLEKYKRKWDL